MNITNILVTGRIYKEVQSILDRKKIQKNFRFLPDEMVTLEDLDWADAFVSFRPSPIFDLSTIKWVHSFGAGVDSFLTNREWKEEVLLTRTICSFGQKIGEYCLSYILRELQFHQTFLSQKNKKTWNPIVPKPLHTQAILIFGTGKIGQEVAKILHSFGMAVIGVSLSGRPKEYFTKVYSIKDQDLPLHKGNFVINTLPLTDETFELFGTELFQSFNDAVFINVGRGATIKQDALITALDQGKLKHAVLDVFTEEPLPETNTLWAREDVTITPHISAITDPDEAVECFLDTLATIEANQPLKNQIDVKKGF